MKTNKMVNMVLGLVLVLAAGVAPLKATAQSDVPDNMLSQTAGELPLCGDPYRPAEIRSGKSCQIRLSPNSAYGLQIDIDANKPIQVSLSPGCGDAYRYGAVVIDGQRDETHILLYGPVSLSKMLGNYQLSAGMSIPYSGCSVLFEAQ